MSIFVIPAKAGIPSRHKRQSPHKIPAFAGMTALCALLNASPVFAAETIKPVVISATGIETPLNQVASSVTVITAKDIEKSRKQNVVDMLRTVPGVTVAQAGGPGQQTSVFMRGTNSNHVLVVIDGVAVNSPSDPSNVFDFSNLTNDNVERIEVLRGPQSTLYGSSAIGGVINIVTKQGKGKPAHYAQAEYGRYNSSKFAGGSSGEIGRTSYSVSASRSHTDGISAYAKKYGAKEKDANNTYTVSANLASKLTENFKAKLSTRYNRTDSEFDFFGTDSPVPIVDNRLISGRVAGEWTMAEGKWVQELGLADVDQSRYINNGFGYTHYTSRRNTVDWVHHIKVAENNTLTAGLEGWNEHYKTQTQSNYFVNNRAAFIQDQFNITDALFMSMGVRSDHHGTFGSHNTWKLAPGYFIEKTGTTLKATAGTGFKAPSLFNLYDPFFGNPNLAPEKSHGYDMGFEQDILGDKVTFGATAFRNQLSNLIDFDNTTFKYFNVAKARTKGVESFVTYRPRTDLQLHVTHTYTQADDVRNSLQLLRRAKHQGTATASWQYSEKGDVSITGRYVGNRPDVNLSFARARLKSFETVDLSTNYKVNETWSVYGRVDNLLNRKYEEVLGYGTPRLGVYGGIKANF